MKSGADPKIKDKSGKTAFDVAKAKKFTKILKYFEKVQDQNKSQNNQVIENKIQITKPNEFKTSSKISLFSTSKIQNTTPTSTKINSTKTTIPVKSLNTVKPTTSVKSTTTKLQTPVKSNTTTPVKSTAKPPIKSPRSSNTPSTSSQSMMFRNSFHTLNEDLTKYSSFDLLKDRNGELQKNEEILKHDHSVLKKQ